MPCCRVITCPRMCFVLLSQWRRGWSRCRWRWAEVAAPRSLPTGKSATSSVAQCTCTSWHIMVFANIIRHSWHTAEGSKNIVCKNQDVCRQQHLQKIPSVAELSHKAELTYFTLLAPDMGKMLSSHKLFSWGHSVSFGWVLSASPFSLLLCSLLRWTPLSSGKYLRGREQLDLTSGSAPFLWRMLRLLSQR